jgi:hypothetical protein
MLPPPADRPKLKAVLEQLTAAVEELLLGGLTTASDSTTKLVNTALQEAARLKMLRFGGTLRSLGENLARFEKQKATFSRARLTFYLNRTWLLCRGLSKALGDADEALYDRLSWVPASQPLPAVEVVCMGVLKKVAAAFVAFEFRLRATAEAPPVKAGQRMTWGVVFPVKPGADIPPEGFLHLPQKQKFSPYLFLEHKTIDIRNAAVAFDESGGGRISLNEASTVTIGKDFAGWANYLAWSPVPAVERIRRHTPGPLDLDTELQEEVVLRDYAIDPPHAGDDPGQTVYPVASGGMAVQAVAGDAAEGKALKKELDAIRKLKKNRPPLYGLMHYERCKLVFQPLTTFASDVPDYITISKEQVNKAALLKSMSFT